MTDTGLLIGVAYAGLVLVVSLLAAGVWLSTRTRRGTDTGRLAEREKAWLVAVVAALTALLAATIFLVPYGKGVPDGPYQRVEVVARQFAWQLRPGTVRAGVPVDFVVTSRDVNHGFGLYDTSGELVAQVQVVPGKTQHLRHTFSSPGRYRILCLEFCGLAHHSMIGEIEVTS